MDKHEVDVLAAEYDEFRHTELGKYTPGVLIGFMNYKLYTELKRLNDGIDELKDLIKKEEVSID